MNPGASLPGCGWWFYHLGAVWPQASFFSTRCLSFLVHKLQILMGLLGGRVAGVSVAPEISLSSH